MKLHLGITALTLVLVAAGAWADHDISVPYTAAAGTATIDGDLSDWADATWILLDEIYAADPSDMSNAKYSVRWDDAANVMLVAVEVTDADHVLVPGYVSWDAQDDIEVSIDAGDNGLPFGSTMTYGQQIVVGADGAGGDWIIASWGNEVTTELVPEYAASVNGAVLSYELSIVPFSTYDGFGGAEPDVEVDLEGGLQLGLDVVGVTAHAGGYGMMANNLVGGKFNKGASLQKWVLEGGSTPLPGDANKDCVVDLNDFVILKTNFGTGTTWDQGDFNGDGTVDLADFVILKTHFGTMCE